jgi:plasmid maintenance system antidote protein VapI
MTAEKREALKRSIKLKALAHLSGTTINYLSLIINNNRSCSLELAEKLAEKANMLQQEITFSPLDFMRNN